MNIESFVAPLQGECGSRSSLVIFLTSINTKQRETLFVIFYDHGSQPFKMICIFDFENINSHRAAKRNLSCSLLTLVFNFIASHN